MPTEQSPVVDRPRSAPPGGAVLLEVEDLGLSFAGIKAIDSVSFSIEAGQITSIIGPNGAGKTSLFNCLSRLYLPKQGRITFQGRDLSGCRPDQIIGLGIARTFQNLALFDSMTVLDNILVGYHCRGRASFFASALRLRYVRAAEERARARVAEIAELLEIECDLHEIVTDLPLGTRKRVELARALMSAPSLLLLDEPAAGLNHTEVSELGRLIVRLRDELGVTILLVEHHMSLVMSISDKVVVLNFGRTIAEGDAATVRSHPEVIRAYLGGAL